VLISGLYFCNVWLSSDVTLDILTELYTAALTASMVFETASRRRLDVNYGKINNELDNVQN
jgi:hypothetical protein